MIRKVLLGDVLTEVKTGVGEEWAKYRVIGATVDGLAPAKERPGKNPERYKPVFPGTVFYNPMRILIGSIAFVDNDDPPGITSPDYVVFRGNDGEVDSRYFYYWLRSPLGHRCITSLARGAVRERMLFNRLAKAEVHLPDFDTQQQVSKVLAAAKCQVTLMRSAILEQLNDLEQLPHRIVAGSYEELK
jgi:type I restriction enzyme, S subunit